MNPLLVYAICKNNNQDFFPEIFDYCKSLTNHWNCLNIINLTQSKKTIYENENSSIELRGKVVCIRIVDGRYKSVTFLDGDNSAHISINKVYNVGLTQGVYIEIDICDLVYHFLRHIINNPMMKIPKISPLIVNPMMLISKAISSLVKQPFVKPLVTSIRFGTIDSTIVYLSTTATDWEFYDDNNNRLPTTGENINIYELFDFPRIIPLNRLIDDPIQSLIYQITHPKLKEIVHELINGSLICYPKILSFNDIFEFTLFRDVFSDYNVIDNLEDFSEINAIFIGYNVEGENVEKISFTH